MSEDTMKRVLEVVECQLGSHDVELTRETHLVNDLGADSLDIVEVTMELEEEFDINIPDDVSTDEFTTIGAIVDAVDKLRGQ